MRTRLVRPEFWSDPTMAELSAGTRLTYIGLWCMSDDAGYFDWDPRLVAGELYRHEDPAARMAHLEIELATLIELGRVRVLGCGKHAVVPTIPEYRMRGGVALYTIKKRHDHRCQKAEPLRRATDISDSVSVSDSVSDSQSRARAQEISELSPAAEAAWRDLGARYGGKLNGH